MALLGDSMNLYKARPELVPVIANFLDENGGQSLRSIAEALNVHVNTVRASVQEEFPTFETANAHFLFPRGFDGNFEQELVLQFPWAKELLSKIGSFSAGEISKELGVPRSTVKFRIAKLRGVGLVD